MKVISSKDGKKTIRMSRKEWEMIGKKAGWNKKNNLYFTIKFNKLLNLPIYVIKDFISVLKKFGFDLDYIDGSRAGFTSNKMLPMDFFNSIKQNFVNKHPGLQLDFAEGPFDFNNITENVDASELPIGLDQILSSAKYFEEDEAFTNPEIIKVEKVYGIGDDFLYTGENSDFIFEVTIAYDNNNIQKRPSGERWNLLIGISKDGNNVEVFQS